MATQGQVGRSTISARLYQATLKTVPSEISRLLAEYSSVPVEEQKEHITKTRNRAYETHKYPCLGRWRFLELDLSVHPLYQTEVLPALKPTGQRPDGSFTAEGGSERVFLDLGCCLGQDMRKLIFDGADASRLFGADLRPEFIDVGYSLFRDRDTFPPSHFVAPADVFDLSPSSPLARLDGKVGILHVCAVFHLFGWDDQKRLARRVLKLLDRRRKRVLVVGAQTANINAGGYERWPGEGVNRYRHNEDSWRRFWEEAVAEDEWKDQIRGVSVESVLEDRISSLGENLGQSGDAQAGGASVEANNTQKQIGMFEEGFRWMKWSVWLEFEG